MGKKRKTSDVQQHLDEDDDDDGDKEHRRLLKKERKRNRKEGKKASRKNNKLLKTEITETVLVEDEVEDSSPERQVQTGGESTAQQELDCRDETATVESSPTTMFKKKKKKDKKKKSKKNLKEKGKDASSEHHEEDDAYNAAIVSAPGTRPFFSRRTEHAQQLLEAQHRAESEAVTGGDVAAENRSRIVASSAIEFYDEQIIQQRKQQQQQPEAKKKQLRAQDLNNITLLLFYTYVEPWWDEATYNFMLKTLQEVGTKLGLTGRMRVAREGLNCTLTGTHEAIVEYCTTLRQLRPKDFSATEFKLTNDLPLAQKFPNLKVFKVVELVHYGLDGTKAPPIAKFQGTHLEPKDYHAKLAQPNTVVIDVRNHYEAAIGRFVPPESSDPDEGNGPQWLDPKMRKSTEFPVWLDKQETKEMMKGKQVLMYCTGGIRCERASALLKYKMETDPEIKELGIKGVYQLQGENHLNVLPYESGEMRY